MKSYLLLLIFFLILHCSSNSGVYWCGDHPCINKKEKEAYFKKTMIVEKKQIKKNSYKKNSEIDKLIEQAKVNEKKRIISEKELIKEAKLEEKRRIKDEKTLLKKEKIEEKRRLKEEKELENAIKKKEKKALNKKSVKKIKKKSTDNKKLSVQNDTNMSNLSKFEKLVEKITSRDKPYPEINDIPN